jgi:hypothetical protein
LPPSGTVADVLLLEVLDGEFEAGAFVFVGLDLAPEEFDYLLHRRKADAVIPDQVAVAALAVVSKVRYFDSQVRVRMTIGAPEQKRVALNAMGR